MCAGLTAGGTQAAPGGSLSHVKRGRGGNSSAFVSPRHLERNPCGLEGEFRQSSGVSGFRDPSMRFSILALEL